MLVHRSVQMFVELAKDQTDANLRSVNSINSHPSIHPDLHLSYYSSQVLLKAVVLSHTAAGKRLPKMIKYKFEELADEMSLF